MANLRHRVRRARRPDVHVNVLPDGATIGSGWDNEPPPGTSPFRIYVHNEAAHYTIGMSREEAEKIVRFLAGGLGLAVVVPETEEED
jgi:hypothetical protein